MGNCQNFHTTEHYHLTIIPEINHIKQLHKDERRLIIEHYNLDSLKELTFLKKIKSLDIYESKIKKIDIPYFKNMNDLSLCNSNLYKIK